MSDHSAIARIVPAREAGEYSMDWCCPICLVHQSKLFISPHTTRISGLIKHKIKDGRCDWCKKVKLPKYLEFFKNPFRSREVADV